MEQSKLLEHMFITFSDSLSNRQSGRILQKNYEKQIDSYSKLFKEADSIPEEEQKRNLICARCLISATRSLLYQGYCDENILAVKQELDYLKPIFSGKRMSSSELRGLIDRRIDRLVPRKSDQMVDAILFMYVSLFPPTKNCEVT